jgi:hypothetical protein
MNTPANNQDSRLISIQSARSEIAQNAQFDKAFIIMNALAAIIASYSLLADSSSGVIGAMLGACPRIAKKHLQPRIPFPFLYIHNLSPIEVSISK